MNKNSTSKNWHRIPVLNDNYVWVISDDYTSSAIVVDPALAQPVKTFLSRYDLELTHILCTHHHYDHIGGITELVDTYGCAVIGSEKDRERIPCLSIGVSDNNKIEVGSFKFQVISLDGHTRGHIGFYEHIMGWAFVGDTLFSLGCGRLFEGTAAEMLASIKKIMSLPKETLIFCAHEYTLDNAKFASSISKSFEPLAHRIRELTKKLESSGATVPFYLKDELETNPFLRTSSEKLQKDLDCVGYDEDLVFAKLRKMKDNF